MQTIVRSTDRLHSKRTLCVASTEERPANPSSKGKSSDKYARPALTSLKSCPNPERETVFLCHWHRIRLDLTGSFSHLQKASVSHGALQIPISHGWSESIPRSGQNVHPTASNWFCTLSADNTAYLATGSSRASFFCAGCSERHIRHSRCNPPTELNVKKQCSVISVESIVLSCHSILSHRRRSFQEDCWELPDPLQPCNISAWDTPQRRGGWIPFYRGKPDRSACPS